MNTLFEISNKITQCSQNDRLEIIFSLRAFLFDNPVHYWIDFSNSIDYEKDLICFQKDSPQKKKKINESNIRKINVKPIDLFLLPKNKKLQLISLIDEIIEDLNLILVYDKLRLNPFYNDDIYTFMSKNKSKFSDKSYNIYKARNDFAKKLLDEAKIETQIYETCLHLSRKNKIIDYWTNLWGQSTNYEDPSTIEHLLIK